jgi:hypothetical protein
MTSTERTSSMEVCSNVTSMIHPQHESKSTPGRKKETATTKKSSTSVSSSPTTTMMSSSLQVSHGFSSNSWYKKMNDTPDDLSSRVASSCTLSPPSTGSRSRSNSIASAALDTLALLASSAHQQLSATSLTSNASSSTMDDSQIMPPPPPRFKGRARSASNPEGMEKWDSYSYFRNHNNNRRHFILPTTILEEELAEVNETCKQKQIIENDINYESYFSNSHLVPMAKRGMTVFSIQGSTSSERQSQPQNEQKQGDNDNDQVYGTSPISVISGNDDGRNIMTAHSTSSMSTTSLNTNKSLSNSALSALLSSIGKKSNTKRKKKKSNLLSVPDTKERGNELDSSNHTIESDIVQSNDENEQQIEDESTLEPEELLRRARNRLLEDLNCSDNCGVEKGVLPLPHSLEKYKEVSIDCISHYILLL